MRIDHQVLTGVSVAVRSTATAQRWMVGQLLSIGVIGRVDESSIRLTVDGREVLARTALDLTPGARLTARVVAIGAQPLLAIVDPEPLPAPAAAAVTTPAATIRGALGRTLPVQEPLTTVLAQIAARATSSALPPSVQRQISALKLNLPDLSMLTQPQALARSVANSGQSLEAKLAAVPHTGLAAPPRDDLKFQLLALRATLDVELQPAPRSGAPVPRTSPGPESAPGAALAKPQSVLRGLVQDVDAGIARITTHQLQHLAAAERGDFYAYAELPYRTALGTDTVRLSIEGDDPSAEHHGQHATEASVALNLAVALEELGDLRARIGLSGARLAVTLWSENPVLRDLITSDIAGLEDRLTALGFELTSLALHEIPPPDPLRALPERLIDTSI